MILFLCGFLAAVVLMIAAFFVIVLTDIGAGK